MFEFFHKNFSKLSRKTASSSVENKSRRRSLFLESLEDRRLLATYADDITLSDLEVLPGGVGPGISISSGELVDIAEGDILRFTGTTVAEGKHNHGHNPDGSHEHPEDEDDGHSHAHSGDDCEEDHHADDPWCGIGFVVDLQLSRPSATSTNQVHSDFSVDVTGSDFDSEIIVSDQLYVGRSLISIDDKGGSVFTYDVIVTDDLLVELDEGFTVQLFKTVDPGADGATAEAHYATAPTLTVVNTDTATIVVNDITGSETGIAGAQTVTYTLDNPIDVELAGLLAVNDGTATETGPNLSDDDYDVTSGTGAVTFQSAGDSEDVVLNLKNDGVVERNETFTVDLSSLTAGGTALATLRS